MEDQKKSVDLPFSKEEMLEQVEKDQLEKQSLPVTGTIPRGVGVMEQLTEESKQSLAQVQNRPLVSSDGLYESTPEPQMNPEQLEELTIQCQTQVNKEIQEFKKFFPALTDGISDGYHTFGELYDHRIALFIALCRAYKGLAWKSQHQSDGEEFAGWFLLGIKKGQGQQITYHLPIDPYWDMLDDIASLPVAPEFDGHTPKDVALRLLNLNK